MARIMATKPHSVAAFDAAGMRRCDPPSSFTLGEYFPDAVWFEVGEDLDGAVRLLVDFPPSKVEK